jgi:hypothetical protein
MSLQRWRVSYVSTTFVLHVPEQQCLCPYVYNVCVSCASTTFVSFMSLQRWCVSCVSTIFVSFIGLWNARVFHVSQQHLCLSYVSTTLACFICLYNVCVPCAWTTTFVSICLQLLCAMCHYNICFLHVSTTLVCFMCSTTFVPFICLYNARVFHVSGTEFVSLVRMSLQLLCFSCVSTTFVCFICLNVRVCHMYVQHLCPSCVSTTFACYVSTTFIGSVFLPWMFTTYRTEALKTHLGLDVTFVRFLRKLELLGKLQSKSPL